MNEVRWWQQGGLVQRRRLWLGLLVLIALAYFGSYWRYGINFRDEGGTEALLAKRLLAGERPFLELILGYNVLWFYPIVGLFKLFGVSFILLRAYCFFLSTITAVTGFLVISRVSRKPWLGFVVGLLLVLVPGMTFKNYMPLLAVTNSACLLYFVLAAPEGRGRRVLAGSVVLGLTFLIRIDVGLFATILWLGAIVLRDAARGQRYPFARVASRIGLLAAIVVLLHLPVYLDAQHRGFSAPFLQQYLNWPLSFVQQVQQRFSPPRPVERHAESAIAPATAPAVVPNQGTLRRKTPFDWSHAKNNDERLLILLLYAPVLVLGSLALWGAAQLGRSWWRREPEHYVAALGALVLIGGALSDFPQYFFFRPDSPHLSEFSPGFWVAAAGSLILLARGRRVVLALCAIFLAAHAGVYLYRMLPDRWTGTIAARKGRSVYFRGENGVHIYLTRREVEGLTQIQDIVRDHTQPRDYLVAYPYHPALNLLLDRATYEQNLYVDNAIAEPNWNKRAIARLIRYQPAVVILSDWDINGTEASRFSHWAAPTKAWIKEHYDDQGSYLDFEVFTWRQPTDVRTPPSPPSSTP